jgi:hypothetical protein
MTLLLCVIVVVRENNKTGKTARVRRGVGVKPSRIKHSVAATLNNRDNVTSSTPAQQQNPQQNK